MAGLLLSLARRRLGAQQPRQRLVARALGVFEQHLEVVQGAVIHGVSGGEE
jgi:hypothetical protein